LWAFFSSRAPLSRSAPSIPATHTTDLSASSRTADPRRPQYAPLPGAAEPDGIVAFYFEPTDDGKSAVVEFVGRNRDAFRAILADRSITVFEKGRVPAAQIETAIRRVRKDFDVAKFGVVMP
jgi:hypothetical protein